MLTRKQRQLLEYLRDYQSRDGLCPSFDEMQAHMGLASRSGIHRLVVALEERGFIRRLPNRARAIEVLKERNTVPVLAARKPAVTETITHTIAMKAGDDLGCNDDFYSLVLDLKRKASQSLPKGTPLRMQIKIQLLPATGQGASPSHPTSTAHGGHHG